MEKKLYKVVNGVNMSKAFDEETFLSLLNYKAKPDDLFVVTYPKCGTTWMEHIIKLIIRKGQVSEDPLDFFLGCPHLEFFGSEYVEKSKCKLMKTHLPYRAVPYSDDAKYIYVTRNVKDCIVSFYYFRKLMPLLGEELTFDEFFQLFLEGHLGYEDYFDHLLEWYKHRNDKNVYFVTYEELKKDIKTQILKLAKFIGDEYENCILEDPEILENIVKYSSFEHMRKSSYKSMEILLNDDEVFQNNDLPSGLIEIRRIFKIRNKTREGGTFVRKGVVGDWKSHFSHEQLRKLNAKIAEKTKGSDVMNLWKDI